MSSRFVSLESDKFYNRTDNNPILYEMQHSNISKMTGLFRSTPSYEVNEW